MSHADELLRLQAAILEKIAVGESVKPCLNLLCELVGEIVGDCVCSVMMWNADHTSLNVAAAPGAPSELISALNGLVPSELAGSCGTAVYLGKPVFVTDTSCDPRWVSMQAIADDYQIRACWSVPVLSRTGEVHGSFALSHPTKRQPNDSDRATLKTATHIAGIAMDRDIEIERLRASERRFQDLFDNSPDMFLSADATTGCVQDCNARLTNVLGFQRDEIIGRSILDLYDPACRHEATKLYDSFLETGELQSDELRVVTKNGIGVDVSLKVTAVRDSAGTIHGSRSVWRDITIRKRTEETIRQSQKLESLGVLASGIAHDFNNLLVGILGNAHLAGLGVDKESDAGRAIGRIEAAGRSAADLTSQLLAYAGRGKLSMEPLGLADLARSMVELLSATTATPLELADNVVDSVIVGDATQIQQVLMNLMTNAVEATADGGGAVNIDTGIMDADRSYLDRCIGGSALVPGRYAYVSVADTGVGMDDATLKRIFDPFFTTKSTGRGLGLAATLGIIASHKGCLHVDSRPQQGTTFRMLCPAAENMPLAQPDAKRTSDAAKPGSDGSHLTALAVDDEKMVLSVLARMLEHSGYDVVTATSGEEAVRAIRKNPQIDVAILDLTMPGLTGHETFDEIRIQRPDLAVVFCSGQSPDDCGTLVHEHSRTAFLAKPFGPDQLNAALQRAVAAPQSEAGESAVPEAEVPQV
ncbi:MAG: response regulator [Planctomycetota bacterium]